MLLGEADLQGPELSGPLEPRHQQSLGNWVQGQKDQICKTKLDDFSRAPSIQKWKDLKALTLTTVVSFMSKWPAVSTFSSLLETNF